MGWNSAIIRGSLITRKNILSLCCYCLIPFNNRRGANEVPLFALDKGSERNISWLHCSRWVRSESVFHRWNKSKIFLLYGLFSSFYITEKISFTTGWFCIFNIPTAIKFIILATWHVDDPEVIRSGQLHSNTGKSISLGARLCTQPRCHNGREKGLHLTASTKLEAHSYCVWSQNIRFVRTNHLFSSLVFSCYNPQSRQ